ncbi:hypothetical protein [Acaryochloris marina]|uniref:HPr kinase/phosphorylase C-terminal domain-containing protein n=1 Tax=Acaryochloris marina (strain MBIC 11017) TaxID=329726 RepID=B0CA06_ACAM1|nr:hypothetical protein [Acaryochloris marina]ABW25446.1 hypothetical protein AM1_0389 [Acaryochloris marina MBIC11017]
MPVYSVFGFCIQSDIYLPELVEADGRPDVVLKIDKLATYHHKHDAGFCFRGRISNILRFLVYKGQEIVIEPFANVEIGLVRSILYGPIFTILLRQQGQLVLHGSCVVLQNAATAFLGHSKAGKSTLAEAFHHHDCSVITDDVLAIQFASDFPTVLPSIPRIKLWPDSAIAMGHQPDKLKSIYGYSSKKVHLLPQKEFPALPLSSIYVLNQGKEFSIIKLNPQQAFLEILKNSRATKELIHPQFVKLHFEQCTALLKKVPVYLLTRPLDLNSISKTVEKIQIHEQGYHRRLMPLC